MIHPQVLPPGPPAPARLHTRPHVVPGRAALRLAALATILLAAAGPALGQTPVSIESAELGIGGRFKVGFWVHARVELLAEQPTEVTVEVVAPDHDGAQVRYEWNRGEPVVLAANETRAVSGLLRVGRAASAVQFRVFDSRGVLVDEQLVLLSRESGALSSTDRLLVVLGDDVGVQRALARRSSELDTVRLVQLDDPSGLPESAFGWETVDALVITSAQTDTLRRVSQPQAAAIEHWIMMGGRAFVLMGSNAEQAFAAGPWLSRLVPGTFDRVVAHDDSAGFETYAQATQPLLQQRGDSIDICRLDDVRGSIEAFEGTGPRDLPLVVRAPLGMGSVVFVAVDVDRPPIEDWQGQERFVARVIGLEGGRGGHEMNGRLGGRVSRIGYSDISGQLRSAMERFTGVQFVTFTMVAIVIVVFILCIGPGDYFLLRKVVKRMEWTWITFGLIVAFFTASAIFGAKLTKGQQLRVNQVEVIDIDAATGQVRGTLWANLYSPRPRQVDVALSPAGELPGLRTSDALLGWQGLPGNSLGGMETAVSTGFFGQSYRATADASADPAQIGLDGVPLRVASTRAFSGRWTGTLEAPIPSELVLDRRSDSLQGDLVNPLPIPLSSVMVFFGSWAYEIDGTFAPGQRIRIDRDGKERTLNGYLTRRFAAEGRDAVTPWDIGDDDIQRIIEVMLFFEAAGGHDYTRLTQRMHAQLDLSGHLSLDRAILFARGPRRATELTLDGQPATDVYDQSWTYYRVILPVIDPLQRAAP